ncbi:MAG: putative lipid II flippase FtsW [Oscillospiraceae bacterium]|nr:putative lipid II flippase FtsW [Oscillospiraceae bacterium]
MVFSSSSEAARAKFSNPYYFIQRQGLWALISLCAMFFFSVFNYKVLKKLATPVLIISIILLIVVLIFGTDVNNAKRWINLGFFSVQPSEITKIAVILFFASSLTAMRSKLKNFLHGLCPYLLVLLVIAGLVIIEPHLSATIVIVLIGCIMLLIAGAKMKHFILLAIPAACALVVAIFTAEYRLKRITSFLDPFADKLGDGWQIIQSLYAISSGGIFGLGLGQSRQKFLYIPEPQNDFIFSITAEELGLLGAILIIGLFTFLIYRGIRIAITAPDTFSALLATGIIAKIAVETVINIAVVTSSMPVTGMPLPFFSYGGTTLLINMSAMGILLNISRYCKTSHIKSK